MSVATRLVDELFEPTRPVTPGERLAFRVIELAIVLAVASYAWDYAQVMQSISEVVKPLALAIYFDLGALWGPLAYVNAAAITGLMALGYGRRWRHAYATALVLMVVQYSARDVFGEIGHSANVPGMLLLALALAHSLFDGEDARLRVAMGFVFFFVGLGYTLAAVCKLIATGWTWPDGRHLWAWIQARHVHEMARSGATEIPFFPRFVLAHWWLATAVLTFGLLSEALAWLVWLRRTRRLALFGIIFLHGGIFLTMGIVFKQTTTLLVLLALPLAAWLEPYAAGRLGGAPLARPVGSPPRGA